MQNSGHSLAGASRGLGQDNKMGDKKEGNSMATALFFFFDGARRTLRLYSAQILPARRMHDVCQVWAMRTNKQLVFRMVLGALGAARIPPVTCRFRQPFRSSPVVTMLQLKSRQR